MRLFLPHSTLEGWLLSDLADLREGRLEVPGEGLSLPTTPASHLVRLVSGVDDHRLVSRVKTDAQLDGLGAERLGESVLVGETVYDAIPGYLTLLPSAGAQPSEKPAEQALLEALLLQKL